jgi:hypothetical protein
MSNSTIKDGLELVKDLFIFINEKKKMWLAPVIFILLLLGILLFALEGTIVAPLIYTIF